MWVKRKSQVLHFWGAELGGTEDPGQDARGAPDPTPLWNILDLTPAGRGTDWYPKLECQEKPAPRVNACKSIERCRDMSKSNNKVPPRRTDRHEALAVFLGDWRATGQSFGDKEQHKEAPRAKPIPWTSTHTARWHTGRFFLVQDERATVGGPFDTLSIMGWDEQAQGYFARSFENHGFYRHYKVALAGQIWTLTGESERARIEFSADGVTQTIVWEWRREDGWLPLCDRVAMKITGANRASTVSK